MAEAGADVSGIDISGVAVQLAQQSAATRGLRANFQVMDCENMNFPDHTFDLVNVCGVLHHMDLNRVYPELARVLKPSGSIICLEALAHNPVFQAYRKITPHLRTAFEADHILRRKDVLAAKRYFNRLEWRFFHLSSLAAVPFRKTKAFAPLLAGLNSVDAALLGFPPFGWWAWQIGFVLSEPKQTL